MNSIFQSIFTMSLSGTLIFILLYALKPLTYKLFNMTWHYYILLVAMLFFVIPCSLKFSFPNSILHTIQEVHVVNTNSINNIYEIGTKTDSFTYVPKTEAKQTTAFTYVLTDLMSQHKNLLISGYRVFFYIWVLGMLAFAIQKAKQYIDFNRELSKTNQKITDSRVLEVFHNSQRDLNINARIELILNEKAYTPMVFGFISPKIILPDTNISSTELNLIFKHELTHYLRFDIWYKSFVLLINAIHWFNPAAYLLTNMVNSLCEISCDEAISVDMEYKERKLYGEMILNMLAKNVNRKTAINPAFGETKKGLKRRLSMIMSFKRSNKRLISLSIFASFVLVAIGIFIGSTISARTMKDSNNLLNARLPVENVNDNADDTMENIYVIAPDKTGKIDFEKVPEVNGYYTLKFAGNLEKQLETFVAYKNWKRDIVENKNDMGFLIAEILLNDLKENKKCQYRINSYLLGLTEENKYEQQKSISELQRRTNAEFSTSWSSVVNDKDDCIKNIISMGILGEDDKRYVDGGYKTMISIYHFYRDPSGRLAKISLEDLWSDINSGYNPLTGKTFIR